MSASTHKKFSACLRHALIACVLVFGLTGCGEKSASPLTASGDGARPLTKIILQTDWYAQAEHGGFYQALVKGYYREAGLDVEINQGGPNSLTVQKVALGKAQFSIGRSDEILISASRGIPLQMLGALMQRDPQAILFHKESGIRDFKDLDGHTIMAVPGSGWITFVERKYGIKLSVTPLDYGLSRFLADKNFVQQCFITNEPFYVKQKGADPGVLPLSETGFSPYRVWYTSRSFAAKNPEVVRAFTAASIRGWNDFMSGDRRDVEAMIGSLNKQMTPEFMAFSADAMKRYGLVVGDPSRGEKTGQIDPARIATQITQLTELGMLGQTVKLADVFDERFLPEEVRVVAAAK